MTRISISNPAHFIRRTQSKQLMTRILKINSILKTKFALGDYFFDYFQKEFIFSLKSWIQSYIHFKK